MAQNSGSGEDHAVAVGVGELLDARSPAGFWVVVADAGLGQTRGDGVELLGDHWSLIVLRDIMFGDRRHFRTLQRESEERIASNILASRLRDLLAAGLLTRDDPGRGRRVTYSLTEAAIQLVPVLAELGWWGLRHRPTTEVLRVRAEVLHEGGPELWGDFMNELRQRHLGAPASETGRPSVSQQLDTAYAAAIESGHQDHRTA